MDTLLVFIAIAFALSKLKNKSKNASSKGKSTANFEEKLKKFFEIEDQSASPVRKEAAKSKAEYASMEGYSDPSAYQPRTVSASTEGISNTGTLRAGSLEISSTEGQDLCDPDLGHDDHSTGCEVHEAMLPLDNADIIDAPALDTDWTSQEIVKAVVMSEILTRPSQRIHRRGS